MNVVSFLSNQKNIKLPNGIEKFPLGALLKNILKQKFPETYKQLGEEEIEKVVVERTDLVHWYHRIDISELSNLVSLQEMSEKFIKSYEIFDAFDDKISEVFKQSEFDFIRIRRIIFKV